MMSFQILPSLNFIVKSVRMTFCQYSTAQPEAILHHLRLSSSYWRSQSHLRYRYRLLIAQNKLFPTLFLITSCYMILPSPLFLQASQRYEARLPTAPRITLSFLNSTPSSLIILLLARCHPLLHSSTHYITSFNRFYHVSSLVSLLSSSASTVSF